MPGMNLTREEAQARSAIISVESYDVSLDLTTGPKTFRSETTVRFSSNQSGASTFIDFIAPVMHSATLNGETLDTNTLFDGIRLTLPSIAATNELHIVADAAYSNTGEGLHRFVDPVDDEVYLYSQFEVADSRRVYPVFEQPDLKATFTFHVTAPDHWQVFSNEMIERTDILDTQSMTWHFVTTPRISSYITAIVAGPYRGIRDSLTSSDGREIDLGVYCRASLAEHLDADEIIDVTRQGFTFYEREFDRAYPFSKYDQIFVPEFNAGAMENAGCVTHTETYVFRSKATEAIIERRAVTVLHELAHMWFGDLVTMTWWNDLWLNESFAEFMSTLCSAEATRWADSAWTTFTSLEKSWAYRQDQLPSTHPIVADIRDLEDVEVNFDGITYAKGASVLRQLVAYVGRDAFFSGVREYFRRYEWSNTTLTDFLTELEKASGRDLKTWSSVWLEKAGVNLLKATIDANNNQLESITVEQSAPEQWPTLRPHRLAIGGYSMDNGSMSRLWRIETDIDGSSTTVTDVAGQVVPDIVLLNDEDLTYAKIRLDDASMDKAKQSLQFFTDSLPRTIIWNAAWDMTRDAQWAASDYLELVLDNIATETDSTVITVLLRQIATTLNQYMAPEKREDAVIATASRLYALAQEAAPGSDAQLQFLKAFALHARDDDQLDLVNQLYRAQVALPGLTVDTDLKWELLTSLAAGDKANESDITDYLAIDLTASGQRAAAGARAAIPSMAAKREAFDLAVFDSNAPNAIQVATIAGFNRCRDLQLLVPYVERYFEVINKVWVDRPGEMAQNIVEGLYPIALAGVTDEIDLIEHTKVWLSRFDRDIPAMTRLVIENLSNAERAVAAQEKDRAASKS